MLRLLKRLLKKKKNQICSYESHICSILFILFAQETFEKFCTLFWVWERGRKERGKKQVTGYKPVMQTSLRNTVVIVQRYRMVRGGGRKLQEEEEERKEGIGRRVQSMTKVPSTIKITFDPYQKKSSTSPPPSYLPPSHSHLK